jgi:hypothetical protein
MQATGCVNVRCNDCDREFCSVCKFGAHGGMTCEEWEATDQHRSEMKVIEVARRCPSCQVPIEKNGGCNDMTCSRCRKHFCFKCGQAQEDHKTSRYYPCS